MLQLKLQDQLFEVNSTEKNTVDINGSSTSIDLLKINSKTVHLLINNQSVLAELVEHNADERQLIIKVNNQVYHFSYKSSQDLLLEKMGIGSAKAKKIAQLKAPMPGLVVAIPVKTGDEIKKGESLLILEAMKMENIIKSPADVKVKKVLIKQGDAVEKNQVLIEFE